jgi:hypothetical protein
MRDVSEPRDKGITSQNAFEDFDNVLSFLAIAFANLAAGLQ